MKELTFITGNQKKADYLAKWLARPIPHHKLDLPEIQSLDLQEVAEYKVREAYARLKKPVLVEDVSLQLDALGRLPGTFIKWFLEEIGIEGLCDLAAKLPHRNATATVMYALFDGKQLKTFSGTITGSITREPRGTYGFGWGFTFIPEGETKTLAEMTDDEARPFSPRGRAIEKLQKYLERTNG